MMSMNSIFPHLVATIVLKKYAPGTFTGLFLNLPIGIYIVFVEFSEKITNIKLLAGFMTVTIFVLIILKPLFKIGRLVVEEY